jgi:hypothetical protein
MLMSVFFRTLNVLLLLLIPAVPLIMSWRKFIHHHFAETSVVWRWLLAITTGSFLWLMLGLLWRPIIGSNFTPRVYVAYVNLAALALIAITGVFLKHAAKGRTLVAVCAVALDWFWVLVVATAA